MLRTSKRADSGWQVISANSLIHLGEFCRVSQRILSCISANFSGRIASSSSSATSSLFSCSRSSPASLSGCGCGPRRYSLGEFFLSIGKFFAHLGEFSRNLGEFSAHLGEFSLSMLISANSL